MLRETECKWCKRPVIVVDSAGGKLTVDREPAPDGSVVIRDDRAAELVFAQRARELLEKAGAPDADRYRQHRCRPSDVNRVRQQKARQAKQERRARAQRATAADAG